MEQAVTITDVDGVDVDTLWPRVKGNLALAIEHSQGEYTLEDIHQMLLSGGMRLWIAYDEQGLLVTSAVCEIVRYPQKRVCYIVLSGGGFWDVWTEAIVCIEEWAKANGADCVSAYARKGIAKKLKDYEYRDVYTVIQKDLTSRRLH